MELTIVHVEPPDEIQDCSVIYELENPQCCESTVITVDNDNCEQVYLSPCFVE